MLNFNKIYKNLNYIKVFIIKFKRNSFNYILFYLVYIYFVIYKVATYYNINF